MKITKSELRRIILEAIEESEAFKQMIPTSGDQPEGTETVSITTANQISALITSLMFLSSTIDMPKHKLEKAIQNLNDIKLALPIKKR